MRADTHVQNVAIVSRTEHVTQGCQLPQSRLFESKLKQAAASVVLELRLKMPDVDVWFYLNLEYR